LALCIVASDFATPGGGAAARLAFGARPSMIEAGQTVAYDVVAGACAALTTRTAAGSVTLGRAWYLHKTELGSKT
jgi:hypothetical protein